MFINICYEDDEYADIIFVPDVIEDIEKIQMDFFEWLFDKTNNHKYWIIENGEKKYCNYGTEVFVAWMNDTLFKYGCSKSQIVSKNVMYCNDENETLYF